MCKKKSRDYMSKSNLYENDMVCSLTSVMIHVTMKT